MIYSLSLEDALLVSGGLLVAGHIPALVAGEGTQRWLRAFPRSVNWGVFLYTGAAAWFVWLVASSDLGEFSSMRRNFLLASLAAYVLGLKYMREFLAVRALGMLALLGAEPLLEAAWMRPEVLRLWMVGLVYGWLTAGLFLVGMPYLMRDAVDWVCAGPIRWRGAAWAGLFYGLWLIGLRWML